MHCNIIVDKCNEKFLLQLQLCKITTYFGDEL